MPALTQFTFGALNPLTVEHYTLRELTAYLTALDEAQRQEAESVG